jgi:hypothetical protein
VKIIPPELDGDKTPEPLPQKPVELPPGSWFPEGASLFQTAVESRSPGLPAELDSFAASGDFLTPKRPPPETNGSNPFLSISGTQSRIVEDLDARRRILVQQQTNETTAAENPMATTDEVNTPIGAENTEEQQEQGTEQDEHQGAPPLLQFSVNNAEMDPEKFDFEVSPHLSDRQRQALTSQQRDLFGALANNLHLDFDTRPTDDQLRECGQWRAAISDPLPQEFDANVALVDPEDDGRRLLRPMAPDLLLRCLYTLTDIRFDYFQVAVRLTPPVIAPRSDEDRRYLEGLEASRDEARQQLEDQQIQHTGYRNMAADNQARANSALQQSLQSLRKAKEDAALRAETVSNREL